MGGKHSTRGNCPHNFFYFGCHERASKFIGRQNPEKPSPLLSLPLDLFRYILTFLSFEEIAYIRMVCRRFNAEGRRMLNQEAARILDECADTKRLLKYKLALRRPTDRVVTPMWDRWVYMDVAEIRLLELLRVYARHFPGKRCCFASGKVLDDAARFMNYEKRNRDLKTYPDETFYTLESNLEESCEEAKGSYKTCVLRESGSEDGSKRQLKTLKKRKAMKFGAKKKEIRLRLRALNKNRKRIRRMNRALEIRVDDLEKRAKKVKITSDEAEWEDYRSPPKNKYKWWAPDSKYGVGYFRNDYGHFF